MLEENLNTYVPNKLKDLSIDLGALTANRALYAHLKRFMRFLIEVGQLLLKLEIVFYLKQPCFDILGS